MIKLLLLCGPSGAGKTYIENSLVQESPISKYTFKKLEQVTTRERRDDKDPYIFLSVDAYKEMEEDLVAKTAITTTDGVTNYYGTIPDFIDNNDIIHTVIVNRKGIDDIKRYAEEHKELNIKIVTFMITSSNPVGRANRDKNFIKEELKSLEGCWDMIFTNMPEQDFYINTDDIYEALKITGMIEEV